MISACLVLSRSVASNQTNVIGKGNFGISGVLVVSGKSEDGNFDMVGTIHIVEGWEPYSMVNAN